MSERVDLEALDALAAAATEGPWTHFRNTSFWEINAGDFNVGDTCASSASEPLYGCSEALGEANAALIVALRNAYPSLAAEVRALREALETEKRLHIAALMLTGNLKLLLSAAHEDVCSLNCRSHFPAGHVHSDADHSEKCRTIRAALGSQP